jgi:hemolysin activation/secretion protein
MKNTKFVVILQAGFALNAFAQTPPDAGGLQQQIERDRKPELPAAAVPARPAYPPVARAPQGITLTVRSFNFAGNTLLPMDKLALAVAGFLGRPIDFAQLQDAATAVANSYRTAGWIVRVYIPEQDFVEGSVTLQIVEAVFGKSVQEGPAPKRVPRAMIERIVAAQQLAGQPIRADAVDRALLLLNDVAGITVSGSLREGAQDGETDLVITTADQALVVGDVSLDNLGPRSTGAHRASANLNALSLFGQGDLVAANAIATQGSKYLRLATTWPLGSDGLRVGLNTSFLDYRVVLAEFSELNSHGTSATYGVEANYPIVRQRQRNLYVNFAADARGYDNFAGGNPSTIYASRSVALGLAGNSFDEWGGGGALSGNLSVVAGSLDLNGSPNQASDLDTTRTAGRYSKLRYSLSRQQVLTSQLSFSATLSGQWADKNLDSSEKFLLGGSTGVRAYPSGEGSGASALNKYSLAGAGLSLALRLKQGILLKTTWARRIGSNPNPTRTGNDQDGSLTKNRFWLTAGLSF